MIIECINSWKKYLPDYQIIEWNEDNFDVNLNTYTTQAYNLKKWAFVSDYARLYALYKFGGVYFDTDVELLAPMSDYLVTDDLVLGFESNDSVATAIMASPANHPFIRSFMDFYDSASFVNDIGQDLYTNSHRITDMLFEKGLVLNGRKQVLSGITVYPNIVFCPNDIRRVFNRYSSKSVSVHHAELSWKSTHLSYERFPNRVRRYLVGVARDLIGTKKLEAIRDRKKTK